MIKITLKHEFNLLEKSLLSLAADLKEKGIARAVTRTAFAARADVMDQLPKIFDRPTPFTMRSIRYAAARPESLSARVFISEDAPKGVSPSKYLGPEIEGGMRGDKRSERAFKLRGMMAADQQWVPSSSGHGATRDAYGNIPGSTMVQILSRVSAFGEQGYSANASESRKRALRRKRMAVSISGTNYFIAKSKSDGRPLGVWELVRSGVVAPVLIFADRRSVYQPRFHFEEAVRQSAEKRLPVELRRALEELMREHL